MLIFARRAIHRPFIFTASIYILNLMSPVDAVRVCLFTKWFTLGKLRHLSVSMLALPSFKPTRVWKPQTPYYIGVNIAHVYRDALDNGHQLQGRSCVQAGGRLVPKQDATVAQEFQS